MENEIEKTPRIYKLQPCSPKATVRIKSHESTVGIEVVKPGFNTYPFAAMAIGECFIVGFEEGNEKTIRNRVSTRNTKDVRQFIVIKHNEFECFEIARIV